MRVPLSRRSRAGHAHLESGAIDDDARSRNALRYRDFALLWSGAGISNAGTWMQQLTVPYVVFDLTDSTTWVGATAFASLMPSFVVTPLAGALADRISRRSILIGANIVGAALACALAVAWISGVRDALVFLIGGATSSAVSIAMQPAWHSILSDVVPPRAVPSAVSLNSAQVGIGRTVGPAVGGLVLATLGPGWAFGINAVSYFGLLTVLSLVRPAPPPVAAAAEGLIERLRLGWRHLRADPAMRAALWLIGLVVFLANPVQQLITPVVERVLHGGPTAIGLLVASYGVGSILGAVVVPRLERVGSRGRRIQIAAACLGMLLAVVALGPPMALAAVIFFGQGIAYMLTLSPLVATFHLRSDPAIRGRVVSLFLVTFTTSLALGAVAQSVVGDQLDLRLSLLVAGLALAVYCTANSISRIQPLDVARSDEHNQSVG